MAAMAAAQNCGTRHDGKKVFAAMDGASCAQCHEANEEPVRVP